MGAIVPGSISCIATSSRLREEDLPARLVEAFVAVLRPAPMCFAGYDLRDAHRGQRPAERLPTAMTVECAVSHIAATWCRPGRLTSSGVFWKPPCLDGA